MCLPFYLGIYFIIIFLLCSICMVKAIKPSDSAHIGSRLGIFKVCSNRFTCSQWETDLKIDVFYTVN